LNEHEYEDENLQHQAEHTRPRRRPSVMSYLAILFAIAFLLLLMAYFQQQRANAEASDNAQKQSVSAVQSIQNLMADNESLQTQLEEAQKSLSDESKEIERLQGELDSQEATQQKEMDKLEKRVQAMSWFWQINEAYVLGRYNSCRNLIADMEELDLVPYLPVENSTDTERFSPAQRYQEICDDVKN